MYTAPSLQDCWWLDGSSNVVSCPDILVTDTHIDRQTDRKHNYSKPPFCLCRRGLIKTYTFPKMSLRVSKLVHEK